MYSNKIVVALFVGAVSAKQLPNINMIGAGMLKSGQADVHNATVYAEAYGQYSLHNTTEGQNL